MTRPTDKAIDRGSKSNDDNGAHGLYAVNGITDQAAAFAAQRVTATAPADTRPA